MVTTTPEVCDVSYMFSKYAEYRHHIAVEGLDAGECEVEILVPGTDLSVNFEVDVV